MMERPWTVVMYLSGKPYATTNFDTYSDAGDCIEDCIEKFGSYEGFKVQLLRWGKLDSEYKT